MDCFLGMPVVTTFCLPEFVRWARVSRRKRQAKKWRKRYGEIRKCKGHSFRLGNQFIFCRCVIAKIKAQGGGQ